jgi:tRNA(Leu) C34 or U34 (ribose-2'-O)-methylase TrmL
MSAGLSLTEFIEYADWERAKWHDWLRQHGDDVLATSAGPHGDGRFQTIGDVVRHIFSAEKRYIDPSRTDRLPIRLRFPTPASRRSFNLAVKAAGI